MGVIDIGTVLRKFDDTYNEQDLTVNEYHARFTTEDGRLRTIRARKNVKSPRQQLKKPPQARGKFRYNLKRNGTMLVQDMDLDTPRAIKVATICFFSTTGTDNFNRVFH